MFFLGPRHFGTLTAYVSGEQSARFRFTSALPVQALKGMLPLLRPYLLEAHSGCRRRTPAASHASPATRC